MVSYLYTPRDHHAVRSAQEYLAKQAAHIARKARAGMRATVHTSPATLVAYISANSWVVECECGAGNATDPAWGVAACFACGAVHRSIVFPPDTAGIEAALLERPIVPTRHWLPGETSDDLRQQTRTLLAPPRAGRRPR